MVGPLTMKLSTLMYHDESLSKQKIVNNNQQPQAIKTCKWCLVGPLTVKLGTLIYHDESSSKEKLHACKQQQTALGKEDF